MVDGPTQVFPDDERVAVLAAYTDHLEDLVAVYRDAVAGDGELLDRAPAEGSWSVAQVLHHLADAEIAHAADLRRVLAEDEPELVGFDPDAYAGALLYEVRPPDDALATILALRQVGSRLLASVPPTAWRRCGRRADGRRVDVAALAIGAAEHLEAHVRQARAALLGLW